MEDIRVESLQKDSTAFDIFQGSTKEIMMYLVPEVTGNPS